MYLFNNLTTLLVEISAIKVPEKYHDYELLSFQYYLKLTNETLDHEADRLRFKRVCKFH